MEQQIYVEMESLKQLRGELDAALSNFTKSFNELEQGITALTAKDFIGQGAQLFKENFESKSKPTLEEVKRDTNNAIEYMDGKIGSFQTTLNKVDDIASGRF